MRILLTNDDGIHAKGLKVLEEIAASLSDDIWIVAPESDQSGVAHSLTLNHPLRTRKVADKTFAVTGTPADCVIMGVRELIDEPVDLILSGVNAGQNVGDYVTYSGTVAGAMEGALMRIPSIAISQAANFEGVRTVPWDTASTHAPALLKSLIDIELPRDTFFNINFPNCSPDEVVGKELATQGKFEHGLGIGRRTDGRGLPYFWLEFIGGPPEKQPGTDIETLTERKIAITPLKTDMTDHRLMDSLRQQVEG